MKNEYDQIKEMLNKIRNIQQSVSTKNLREQVEQSLIDTNNDSDNSSNSSNNTDIAVINNVDVEIHSDDTQDLTLKDEEKGQISQLIDDFRSKVSEIAELEKLDLYNNSGKLTGKIEKFNLQFMLSAGDDEGLYIQNTEMLKIDDESLDTINKLKTFLEKFKSTINILLVNRKEN